MSFRPIWGKPRLVNDWGEEQEERETHWTSLFYDLLIVAAVAAISEPFMDLEEEEDEETGNIILQLTACKPLVIDAVLQFLSVVIPWCMLNEITAIFEDESLAGHLAFFIHSLGMAATTAGCVGELKDNYVTLGRGIIMGRIGLLVLHLRPCYYIERSRSHCLLRAFQATVVILVVLFSISSMDEMDEESYAASFQSFRWVLLFVIIWDLASIPMTLLLKCERLPIHIASFSDRLKEVTMVIFGEAIFAVTLQPRQAETRHHFYVALFLTLWLIYSMALHEHHIAPSVDDHALRRSVGFGLAWTLTSYVKQVVLLGASIGIKRTHYLVWTSQEMVDTDTQSLLVWGISATLLTVVAVRSYSFGWGRHPSSSDPPKLYMLKSTWWALLVILSAAPFVVKSLTWGDEPNPIHCLSSLGVMMAIVLLIEAGLSNVVAFLMNMINEDGEASERYFVRQFGPKSGMEGGTYGAVPSVEVS